MTNQEALELIKRTERCFVVWATDRNEVVAVHRVGPNNNPEEMARPLQAMSTDYQGPTAGRFFESANVTLGTLEAQQTDQARINRRVEIFNEWAETPTEGLIRILERTDFQDPMDAYHGSSVIIRMLYRYRWRELTAAQLDRLDKVAATPAPDRLEQSAKDGLECYLCVLRGDPERLKRFWERRMSRGIDAPSWDAFTTAAGDLRVTYPEIIAQLIDTVGKPFMFGPRFEAMVALGKIGAPAGARAAEVIRAAVYDSTPEIIGARDRSVSRIMSDDAGWLVCAACERGQVPSAGDRVPWTRACGSCYGLGFVLRHLSGAHDETNRD
jgi:hypothetical protein